MVVVVVEEDDSKERRMKDTRGEEHHRLVVLHLVADHVVVIVLVQLQLSQTTQASAVVKVFKAAIPQVHRRRVVVAATATNTLQLLLLRVRTCFNLDSSIVVKALKLRHHWFIVSLLLQNTIVRLRMLVHAAIPISVLPAIQWERGTTPITLCLVCVVRVSGWEPPRNMLLDQ